MSDVFDAGLLRRLDVRGRRELAAVLAERKLDQGATLFEPNEGARELFVVLEGSLRARRPGLPDRLFTRGEILGEEALSTGATTRLDHVDVVERAIVAALPGSLARRALVRAGGARELAAIERRVRREGVTRALEAFVPDLEARRRMADAAQVRDLARGEALELARSRSALVLEGLLTIERTDGARSSRVHHAGRGDWFVPEEDLRATAGQPARVAILDRAESRVARENRPNTATDVGIDPVWHRAATARSLLVVVAARCTDCGACGTACADAHPDGLIRLRREGDVVGLARGVPLVAATSCQHCVDPACVAACPTGALRPGASGRVDLSPELCTGCGACESACPWNAVSLFERVKTPLPKPHVGAPKGAPVAVKCDECRAEALGPACVRACPTGAIFRVDAAGSASPSSIEHAREAVLTAAPAKIGSGPPFLAGALAGAGLAVAGLPPRVMGWVVAAAFLLLAGYRPLGRLVGARLDRSIHVGLGALVVFATAGHAVAAGRHVRLEDGLSWSVGLALVVGVTFVAAQARLPMRRAAAPEAGSLGAVASERRRAERLDQILARLSGAESAVKHAYSVFLAPYDRRGVFGAIRWVCSRTPLGDETRALAARAKVYETLARPLVERRALSGAVLAARTLTALSLLHVGTVALAFVLAVVHVLFRSAYR